MLSYVDNVIYAMTLSFPLNILGCFYFWFVLLWLSHVAHTTTITSVDDTVGGSAFDGHLESCWYLSMSPSA